MEVPQSGEAKFSGGSPPRPILCSFWDNPANLYVGAPLPQELAPLPTGNPVFAPANYVALAH